MTQARSSWEQVTAEGCVKVGARASTKGERDGIMFHMGGTSHSLRTCITLKHRRNPLPDHPARTREILDVCSESLRKSRYYNLLMGQLLSGRKLDTPTVEYCRHPGNGYDRQYEKYRYPFGQYAEVAPAEEHFRLQLGGVIYQHVLPRLENECQRRLVGHPSSFDG
jgi:hypothetical protein